jgi:plasmid replication initiation protein
MIKDITIYQDNAITRAAYDMSALEKDILLILISQINKDDKPGQSYFIEAREIIERKGDRIEFDDFRKAGRTLLTRVFETWIDNNTKLLQSSFISSAIYHKGQGLIEMKIDMNVLPFYSDLKKNFTTIQLNMALGLSSKYSKRLYEYVSMLKNFPNPYATIDLMELKKRLGVATFNGDKLVKDTYANFADFDKRVLKMAKTEIDSTDVNFTYELIYDKNRVRGRKKVAAIKFIVTKVKTLETVQADEQYHTIFSRLVNEFRLRKDQAQQVLATMSRQEIHKTLYDISLERPKIRTIGAYTAKAFNLV